MGIARGAVYLHEASIITHSHLNPENILLDGDMNPIISNVSAPYEAYITTAREMLVVGLTVTLSVTCACLPFCLQ